MKSKNGPQVKEKHHAVTCLQEAENACDPADGPFSKPHQTREVYSERPVSMDTMLS